MLKGRLPPLDNLVAFEAAARLLSFTRAAAELNVTQAAVSQQIRNLEARLGLKLFERTHRRVRLTAAGREYQHTVSAALRHLASATGDIRQSETRPRLTVACDQSVAALILMPQLSAFHAAHPEVTLRLIVSDDTDDCLGRETHLALIHGDGKWPGFSSRLLFEEEIFPVCSPDYVKRNGAVADLAGLAACDLLNLDDQQWHWINWRTWFSRSAIDLPFEQRSFEINSYPLLIGAARDGLGVALGWRYLVDADLATGRLVRPLDVSVKTEFGYYLAWPDAQPMPEDAKLFTGWITALVETD